MNCDWESSDTSTGLTSHIPIKKELKEEYDEWVEKECDDRWWDEKDRLRIERIETPTQDNPFHSNIVKELIATEDGKKILEDYYNKEQESFSRRLKIGS